MVQYGEPVRPVKEVEAVGMEVSPKGETIIDFGQLSSTYEFIESIPLAWNIEAICTYTGIRHRYSGKLLAG